MGSLETAQTTTPPLQILIFNTWLRTSTDTIYSPTIVNDDSRYASPSPQPAEASNSSNNNNNTRPHGIPRGSTLWSRDLQYLLSSVVHGEHDQSPREVHIHHHHHGRREGRGRDHHVTGAIGAAR